MRIRGKEDAAKRMEEIKIGRIRRFLPLPLDSFVWCPGEIAKKIFEVTSEGKGLTEERSL